MLTLTAFSVLTVLLYGLWTPDVPSADLEARYLEARTDLRPVGPWRLHVRDSGPRHAPVVVLLHGFGASLQTWDLWARGLSQTHRVIRLDFPGSGLSPPDPERNYTDARSLQLLRSLLDELGVSRATMVGHSMGGRIAWTFAAKYPERTERLVLIAPDGFASEGFEYGKPPQVPAIMALMRYVLPQFVLRMNLQGAYAQAEHLSDALTARYHDLLRAPGARQAMLDRLKQTVLQEPEPMLRQIKAPTLLIWGQEDAMIPASNARDYLKAIVGSRLFLSPGVGHLPHEEASEVSLKALVDFLH